MIFLHNFRKGGCASEIGRQIIIFPHNKSADRWNLRFIIIIRHTIISYKRIGHNDRLIGIGRIRNNLLISDHRCIKDNFAHAVTGITKTVSVILLPILQNNFSVIFHDFIGTSLYFSFAFRTSESFCSNRFFRVSFGISVG